jgi:alkylhydroperoxidase family enzyme
VIADPRAVAARWPEPRLRALAELACVTTEAPWELSHAHHARARAAGLSDDEVLHAVALAALFGHLNRIADAVEIPLDYSVRREPPRAVPAVPPFLPAPAPITGEPVIALGRREATAARLAAWRAHVARPSEALDGPRRARIATWVGRLLGDAAGEAVAHGAADGANDGANDGASHGAGHGPIDGTIDHALLALAGRITLAPWTLDAASYAPLRAAGFSDRDVFDACVVASSAGVFSRIEVALIALGR